MEKTTKDILKTTERGESITLRFDRSVLNTLREEARLKGITLNRLVSRSLEERVKWHANAGRAGFISVRRKLMVMLLEKYSEHEICSIAEYIASRDTKDSVLLLRGEYNLQSVLDVLENWVGVCGYPYRHEVHFTKHAFVIQHDMSKKWSLYLAELFKNIGLQFNLKNMAFDITEGSLAFTLNIDEFKYSGSPQ